HPVKPNAVGCIPFDDPLEVLKISDYQLSRIFYSFLHKGPLYHSPVHCYFLVGKSLVKAGIANFHHLNKYKIVRSCNSAGNDLIKKNYLRGVTFPHNSSIKRYKQAELY